MKLLLAVDGSSHALNAVRHAIRLHGECPAAAIHLLSVAPSALGWQTHGMEQSAIESHLRLNAERAADNARALLDEAGVPYTAHVEIDDPARAIARMAEKLGCDGIVLGSRGLGALSGLVLGSVAMKVLAQAKVPVTLVR